MASASLTTAQKTAIALAEQKTLAGIYEKEAADQVKAAEAGAKAFQDAAAKVNSAVDSQVDGLLKGTETWRAAMKNVLASLTEDAIKFFLNLGLKAVENAALQIASQSGIAEATVASQAVQTSAIAAGAAAQKAINQSTIIADAGRAAAGAYAAVAGIPVVGPVLAPIAAGVAFAGVEAFESLDVGGYVLSDGLAMIHRGETVTPASVVKPYAGAPGAAAAGGDTHVHFAPQVTAIDAGGVQAFLAEHGPKFALEMARLMNSQPRLRPSY